MSWADRITVTPDPHARRGDPQDCAVARPLRQVYGGDWSVSPSGACQTDDRGRVKSYRMTWRDTLRIMAFDAGLPVSRRRVTLTRRRPWLLVRLLPLIVVAWAVGWLAAAGYAWTLALAAWFALMGAAGLVAKYRANDRELAATRAAAASRTGTAVSRPAPTARPQRRTTAPGARAPAPAAVDQLPAWAGGERP